MSDTLQANEPRFFFNIGSGTTGEADSTGFEVTGFNGSEGISELYQYKIELCTDDREINFSDVIGKEATLKILALDKTVERYVCGIIKRLDLVGIEEKDTANTKVTYNAYLVPPQHRLTLRRNLRIFQDQTVKQVVDEILSYHSLTADWKTSETYEKRDYCVQYRETDMDFISRLLEVEGIAYHFQHSAGGVEMVFTDTNAFKVISGDAELMYNTHEGFQTDEEFINEFVFGQQMRTGKVELRDYNFKAPASPVEGSYAAEKGMGESQLDHYDFLCDYDGEFKDGGLIQRLAKVRLQELETEYQLGNGSSDCARFSAGAKFTLGNERGKHPLKSVNDEYLIVQYSHWGSQDQAMAGGSGEATTYHNRFMVIPSKTTFRPPRVTLRPMALGIHTAKVVGAEEVDIDTYGRIKVQFHWEREQRKSFWIRVAQNWAGAGWGGVFHPRKDQEVLVSFIEGDPDRPIITGRVYNEANPPPYRDPSQGKTKSTIKSHSSPGGGPDNYNELRFDDLKGEEQIYLQAEKDMHSWVKHDRKSHVDNDETTKIGGNHTEDISKNETRTVQDSRTLAVTNSSTHTADTITLEGKSMITIKVGSSTIVLTPSGITIKNLSSAVGSGGGSAGPVEIKGNPVKINC